MFVLVTMYSGDHLEKLEEDLEKHAKGKSIIILGKEAVIRALGSGVSSAEENEALYIVNMYKVEIGVLRLYPSSTQMNLLKSQY